jgi:glucose-1-phosphate adenylyltransferase
MEYADVQRNISRDIKYTLALILAGGRGRRLKDLTRWRVKPAVPFGGKFRIIDFALSNCINSGIRKIGVLTQYKSQSLIRHIVNGWGMLHAELGEFIEILPAQQRLAERWYSGTADAVYQNIDIIRRYNPEFVLILAGDHVYKMDYGPLISFHRLTNTDLTISAIEVPVEEASRFGVLAVDAQGRVIRFEEKPEHPTPIPGKPGRALISMGIYVFDTDFLFDRLIRDADDSRSQHDFGHDIIPELVHAAKVMAYPFRGTETGGEVYWRDVGTVDAYWQANMELVGVSPELNLYDEAWPVRSNASQHPPAKFVFNDDDRRGMAVDSLVSNGCIVSGAYVVRSLLFTGVRVEAYSVVRESVILPGAVIEPGCRITRAVIDKGCVVPEGTVIGACPDEDAARFYTSPGGVVLVTPEMLGQMLHYVR